jgi:hypothetical protein
MRLHMNVQMILGANRLAAQGTSEPLLAVVKALVVGQRLRLEEAQVAPLTLGAHLQVRV